MTLVFGLEGQERTQMFYMVLTVQVSGMLKTFVAQYFSDFVERNRFSV